MKVSVLAVERYCIITSDKGGGTIVLPVFVCLSVCLLARLLKNVCMDLDDMLRVDRGTSSSQPDGIGF